MEDGLCGVGGSAMDGIFAADSCRDRFRCAFLHYFRAVSHVLFNAAKM